MTARLRSRLARVSRALLLGAAALFCSSASKQCSNSLESGPDQQSCLPVRFPFLSFTRC